MFLLSSSFSFRSNSSRRSIDTIATMSFSLLCTIIALPLMRAVSKKSRNLLLKSLVLTRIRLSVSLATLTPFDSSHSVWPCTHCTLYLASCQYATIRLHDRKRQLFGCVMVFVLRNDYGDGKLTQRRKAPGLAALCVVCGCWCVVVGY